MNIEVKLNTNWNDISKSWVTILKEENWIKNVIIYLKLFINGISLLHISILEPLIGKYS